YYLVRAELQTAHELSEQFLSLAQQTQNRALLVAAHRVLGMTLFYLGETALAHTHFTQAMALYDRDQYRASVFVHGQDAERRIFAALALWYLGYLDQGLARSQEALTLAQQVADPYSLGYALCWAAVFHQFRREVRAVQERAEAAMSLAMEQGFLLWVAYSSIL